MATILPPDEPSLATIVAALQAGDLVALPTETVYGLAANALDATACRKVFEAKGRPATDPLIVHVRNSSHARELATWNRRAEILVATFWPGPLTLILPRKAIIPDVVTAGGPTVALRSPGHALFRRILETSRLALAAPSANPFGGVSPTTAQHVYAGLGARVPYILDGGSCEIGIESTIVAVPEKGPVRILRPGGISREQLVEVLGEEVEADTVTASADQAQEAPGQLSRHYAPQTRLLLHPFGAEIPKETRIFFARPRHPTATDRWLCEDGNPATAARNLYAVLRELDATGGDVAHVELAPESGIGLAINDRLRRAAAEK